MVADTKLKRKRKRGINQKTRRVWESDDGYRMVWRREYEQVTLSPGVQVTVRSIRPHFRGEQGECWDFVHRRLYRTRKAAETDIEKHRKVWSRVVKATGIRGVQKSLSSTQLPYSVPEWAWNQMPEDIQQLFRPL